ncbi:hypothetical protein ACN2CC_26470 [Mesorhizobium muleiense]|uniref:hypothetical protein n=1 Tax=Mesorhizobium muleiense TaxID=1004279 RepID=UPI003AFAC3DA
MASKMDLIMAGAAGHILAAGVRQDMAGPQPGAAALVGDALMMRDPVSGNTLLNVASAHLSVQAVDLRDDVLMTARDFILVDSLPEKGADPHATPVQLDGATITVNLPSAAPEGGATVWVYVEGAPQPIIHQVEVLETSTSANEPLVLPSGDYCALVLAPGCRAAIVETSIP